MMQKRKAHIILGECRFIQGCKAIYINGVINRSPRYIGITVNMTLGGRSTPPFSRFGLLFWLFLISRRGIRGILRLPP
jgi:hypothetical protein